MDQWIGSRIFLWDYLWETMDFYDDFYPGASGFDVPNVPIIPQESMSKIVEAPKPSG
jgi:hypothetical protein